MRYLRTTSKAHLPITRADDDDREVIMIKDGHTSGNWLRLFSKFGGSLTEWMSADVTGKMTMRKLKATLLNAGVTNTASSATVTTTTTNVTSTAAPRTITMPATANLESGDIFIVKDASNACAVNNITIVAFSGATYTFGGAANYVMNVNGQVVWLQYDGTNFQVI